MKSVINGSYKANVRAGAKTFWKSEPERKQKVLAPQHCIIDLALKKDRYIASIYGIPALSWNIHGKCILLRINVYG
jgi:hypothetical protein